MKNRHIAVLRGINVGGKNKLPMKTLVALFEAAGAKNCRHYIQSGNVVFDAAPSLAKSLAVTISASIKAELGLKVPVILRSAEAYQKAIAANPFIKAGADETGLCVGFLAERPAAKLVAALDPLRSSPDRFQVLGAEVFMDLPNGAARSKLTTAWFDSQLQTTSTFRNWKTCLRLLAMTNED